MLVCPVPLNELANAIAPSAHRLPRCASVTVCQEGTYETLVRALTVLSCVNLGCLAIPSFAFVLPYLKWK